MDENAMIERLKAKLSPEAQQLMEDIEKGRVGLGDIGGRLDQLQLPADEFGTLQRILRMHSRAASVVAEEHREDAEQLQKAGKVFDRAIELEGGSEGMTLRDAVEVLRRHDEEPPEGLDLEGTLKVPVIEKVEHKPARITLQGMEGPLPEDGVSRWADQLALSTMRVVAAVVWLSTGSLDRAASVLYWSGYRVPPGYFDIDEDDEAAEVGMDEEAELRLWVERDQHGIRRIMDTELFRATTKGHR